MFPISDLNFDNFVLTAGNEHAYRACKAFAEYDVATPNIILIWGFVAVGKTHLLHAIANHAAKQNPSALIAYMSILTFMNELFTAIAVGDIEGFRERRSASRLLLVDDIHFLEGKPRTQEEINHIFNRIIDSGGRLALTSTEPANKIHWHPKGLKSIIRRAMVLQLDRPTERALYLIISKKFAAIRPSLSPNILKLVCQKAKSDTRIAEGIVRRMITLRSQNGSYPGAREVLSWFAN